jgi:hypothetical protein
MFSFCNLQVKALDPDLMDITYSLEGSPGFSIGSTSGIISVTGTFDRERQSVYNITVTARDQGGLNVSEQGNRKLPLLRCFRIVFQNYLNRGVFKRFSLS